MQIIGCAINTEDARWNDYHPWIDIQYHNRFCIKILLLICSTHLLFSCGMPLVPFLFSSPFHSLYLYRSESIVSKKKEGLLFIIQDSMFFFILVTQWLKQLTLQWFQNFVTPRKKIKSNCYRKYLKGRRLEMRRYLHTEI